MGRMECEYCEQTFERSESYDRHLRAEHDDNLDEDERERLYGVGLTRPSAGQIVAVVLVTALVVSVGAYEWLAL